MNATFLAIDGLILKYLPHVGYAHMYRTSNKEEDPGKLYNDRIFSRHWVYIDSSLLN